MIRLPSFHTRIQCQGLKVFDILCCFHRLHFAGNYFCVTVITSEASQRCGLKNTEHYLLSATPEHISLTAREDTANVLYVWPYRYLRRYGSIKNDIMFEAGRCCSSGPGVFNFQCDDGSATKLIGIIKGKYTGR